MSSRMTDVINISVAGSFICPCPALLRCECTQQMGNFMVTNGTVYPFIVPVSAIRLNPLPGNKKISPLPFSCGRGEAMLKGFRVLEEIKDVIRSHIKIKTPEKNLSLSFLTQRIKGFEREGPVSLCFL